MGASLLRLGAGPSQPLRPGLQRFLAPFALFALFRKSLYTRERRYKINIMRVSYGSAYLCTKNSGSKIKCAEKIKSTTLAGWVRLGQGRRRNESRNSCRTSEGVDSFHN